MCSFSDGMLYMWGWLHVSGNFRAWVAETDDLGDDVVIVDDDTPSPPNSTVCSDDRTICTAPCDDCELHSEFSIPACIFSWLPLQ